MTRPAYRRLRCLRCSAPSPEHPDANKYGGVTLARDGICVPCDDLLSRKGAWRSLFYRLNQTPSQTDQRTLTEAYDGR